MVILDSVAQADNRPTHRATAVNRLMTHLADSCIIDLVGVQGDLSERLGVAADLHTRRGLHYWIKDQILAEAVQLF